MRNMFKVNNKFIVRLEHISHPPCSSDSIVNFEHVIASWVYDVQKQPTEVLYKKDIFKHFAKFTGK